MFEIVMLFGFFGAALTPFLPASGASPESSGGRGRVVRHPGGRKRPGRKAAGTQGNRTDRNLELMVIA